MYVIKQKQQSVRKGGNLHLKYWHYGQAQVKFWWVNLNIITFVTLKRASNTCILMTKIWNYTKVFLELETYSKI